MKLSSKSKQRENKPTVEKKQDFSRANLNILHKTATTCHSIKKPKSLAKKPQQVQTNLKKVNFSITYCNIIFFIKKFKFFLILKDGSEEKKAAN